MADPAAGRLPQWWLDYTPHDTLEDKVERRRKKKEAERAKAEAEAQKENTNGVPTEVTVDSRFDGSVSQPSPLNTGYVRTLTPKGPGAYETDYEKADYGLERLKLKHTGVDENGESGGPWNQSTFRDTANGGSGEQEQNTEQSTASSTRSTSKSITTDEPSIPEDMLSPLSQTTSTASDKGTFSSPRKPREFKTAFTGCSVFDFAMQQKAREQERREKERLARESLSHHHADKVEVARATENKAKVLEQLRKKKEAEDNLKGFKKVTLDGNFDKASELKRLQQEDKRQKKEAEKQHHEYKGL